jgi:hypothetical protein
MDGSNQQGMSDELLEKEIEAALGVDPSPEFLPRLRARIADDRTHAGWTIGSWRWAGAALGVVAVTLGLWLMRDTAPVSPEQTIATAPRRAEPGAPAANQGTPPPAFERLPLIDTAASAPRQRVVESVPRARQSAPDAVAAPLEVLISQDEAAGLQRLFSAIGDRRIETSTLPDLATALKPPEPIADIVVEPITINPLAATEGE